MAKQQTAQPAATPATPPAETASAASPPVDAASQPQDTPPAQQETPEPQAPAPQPASEPTVRERLKDLSDNSPYLEQQQIAMEALSKWDTAQMWHETAEMWANKAFNYK